jgi:two-component system alkaline phosphatase synthesis response regulator PhoP
MKILLIDDEQSILDVFGQILQTAGHEVITSSTGYDGIEKAKEHHPDLILLDQVMTDVTGNQVLQMLKQQPLTSHIPVVILSNFDQANLVKDAITLGALDYIAKYKISPSELSERLERIMAEAGAQTH